LNKIAQTVPRWAWMIDTSRFLCQSLTMQLFSNMPRRDRIVIAAAALLYLSGQLCESLLDWSVIATEAAALLMLTVGGAYVLSLFYARHLS
jgi:hypothetical protein